MGKRQRHVVFTRSRLPSALTTDSRGSLKSDLLSGYRIGVHQFPILECDSLVGDDGEAP